MIYDVNQIVKRMGNNNPGAIKALVTILSIPGGKLYLDILEDFDIRGSKLYKLWKQCCGENKDDFILTMGLIGYNVYTKEQIAKNLDLPISMSFIDKSIDTSEVIDEDGQIDLFSDEWFNFCNLQQTSFNSRMDEKTPESHTR